MKILITSRYFRFGFSIVLQFLKNKEIVGISNRTYEGFYIPFIDYDGLKLEWIINEIMRIQKDFKLSDFYIFKSSKKGYHAVCFDKMLLQEFIILLKNTSVDKNYLSVPLKYGLKQWNLRVSKKNTIPKLITMVTSSINTRRKSLPHIKFFEKLYNINIKHKNNDKSQKNIYICSYKV